MPTLPRYESNRNITSEKPGVVRSGSGESIASAAKGLSTVVTAAEKWNDALETMRFTTGKNNLKTQIAEMNNKIVADPNYNNQDTYIKELNGAFKVASAGIKDRGHLMSLEHERNIAFINIAGEFKRKQLNFTRKEVLPKLSENTVNNAISGDQNAIPDFIDTLEQNMSEGIISEEEAKMLIDETQEKIRTGIPENEVWKNPEKAIKDINAGKYELNDKEKGKLLSEAKGLIDKREKEAKDIQDKKFDNGAVQLSDALVNGDINPELIKSLVRSGDVDVDTATAFQEGIYNKSIEIPDDTRRAALFSNLLESCIDDKAKAKDVIIKATKALNKGSLKDREEYAFFLQLANKKLNPEQNKGFLNKIKDVYDAVKSFADVGNIWHWVTKGIIEDKPISQIVDSAKKQKVINTNPSLVSYDDPVEESYRVKAIEILKSNGYPVGESNIKSLIEQLKEEDK